MNRQEKVESIRRGEAVIKNDMKGSYEAVKILNLIDNEDWSADGDFYGIGKGKLRLFGVLLYSELNSRPQILMSELVEEDMFHIKEPERSNSSSFDKLGKVLETDKMTNIEVIIVED